MLSRSYSEVKVLAQRKKELELTVSQGKLRIQETVEMLDHLALILARTSEIRPRRQAPTPCSNR